MMSIPYIRTDVTKREKNVRKKQTWWTESQTSSIVTCRGNIDRRTSSTSKYSSTFGLTGRVSDLKQTIVFHYKVFYTKNFSTFIFDLLPTLSKVHHTMMMLTEDYEAVNCKTRLNICTCICSYICMYIQLRGLYSNLWKFWVSWFEASRLTEF